MATDALLNDIPFWIKLFLFIQTLSALILWSRLDRRKNFFPKKSKDFLFIARLGFFFVIAIGGILSSFALSGWIFYNKEEAGLWTVFMPFFFIIIMIYQFYKVLTIDLPDNKESLQIFLEHTFLICFFMHLIILFGWIYYISTSPEFLTSFGMIFLSTTIFSFFIIGSLSLLKKIFNLNQRIIIFKNIWKRYNWWRILLGSLIVIFLPIFFVYFNTTKLVLSQDSPTIANNTEYNLSSDIKYQEIKYSVIEMGYVDWIKIDLPDYFEKKEPSYIVFHTFWGDIIEDVKTINNTKMKSFRQSKGTIILRINGRIDFYSISLFFEQE